MNMHLIHIVWESWEKHTSMWLGLLHAFCNLSIQLVSQLTLFPLPPSPPTICCLALLVEPFKGIAKVFPSHRGASSQCYWPPTGDCRLKTEADAIVLYCHSFIRFAVSAEAFSCNFYAHFPHCNGPLSQYKRCEDYFNCDSCNASRCCLCDEGTVLFQLTFHFFHSLSSQPNYHIYFASFSTLFDKLKIPSFLFA